MTRHVLRAAGRIGALLAVGVILAASSVPCHDVPPPLVEEVTFRVVSDCGPEGTVFVTLAREPYWCVSDDEPAMVMASGAAPLGLPTAGELTLAPPDVSPRDSRGIAAGDFYLAGSVALPGAVPATYVDRVCRFSRVDTDVLEMICLGPAEGANCTGTLTSIPTPQAGAAAAAGEEVR